MRCTAIVTAPKYKTHKQEYSSQCLRQARKGKSTCWSHRKLEETKEKDYYWIYLIKNGKCELLKFDKKINAELKLIKLKEEYNISDIRIKTNNVTLKLIR